MRADFYEERADLTDLLGDEIRHQKNNHEGRGKNIEILVSANVREHGTVYRNDRIMQIIRDYFPRQSTGEKKYPEIEVYTIVGDIKDLALTWSISKHQAELLAKVVDEAIIHIGKGKPKIDKPTTANEWNGMQFQRLIADLD